MGLALVELRPKILGFPHETLLLAPAGHRAAALPGQHGANIRADAQKPDGEALLLAFEG
jgi:hypothetical protein